MRALALFSSSEILQLQLAAMSIDVDPAVTSSAEKTSKTKNKHSSADHADLKAKKSKKKDRKPDENLDNGMLSAFQNGLIDFILIVQQVRRKTML